MSFVQRTAKKSPRLIAIGLLITLVSTIVFASKWDSVTSFASQNTGISFLGQQPVETNNLTFLLPTFKTVCSGGGADFLTIGGATGAVNDANVNFPTGNVTYNVCAGHTETLTAAVALTATGSLGNDIIFQKSGAGANPLVTAYVGTATPTSATPDGMFRIQGGDYVTIDGIDFTDPNAANPATMEYGIGLFKASLSDGAQNNTIKNCVITVKTINNASGTAPMIEGSVGILMINSTAIAATTALTPTTAAGTNSNNKFYTNTINGGNYGMGLIGFAGATPFTTCDFNNDIGGAALATGNTIQNFGGGAATNPSAAIRTLAQYSINVSYNTVNNNTGANTNHATTFRGIYLNTATSANATISNNTVTLRSGATTSTVTAIDNQSGSTAASNTIAISNNTVSGAYTTATTGVWNGIVNGSTAATVNINSNIMTGFDLAGTGTHVMIETGSPTTATANSNSITSITRGGASGSWRIIKTTSPTNFTANSNTISGLSWTAAASTGGIDAIYSFSSAVNVTANSNTITNLSTPTTGTITGINEFGTSGLKTLQNNTISNFLTTAGGAGGATFRGISESTGSTNDISGNTIFSLNSTGTSGGTSGTIVGITVSSGTTNNIYKNKIYDLSSTSTNPTVAGITQSGGTTNTIYNNLIGDLRATAANAANPLIGLNITGGTTNNIYFNTVNLNGSSTGALFGSSAISVSTTPTVNLRNNIFVNTSTAVGAAGFTSAYRRSTATLTSYSTNSNNNLFYAGTPGAANLIFYDGTNSDLTLANFKARVTPRDAASVTENPPFLSTTGSSALFLHISTVTPTFIESGGSTISGITDDFDGNVRAGSPDIGADEFTGVSAGDFVPPSINYTALGNTSSTADRTLATTITDATGIGSGAGAPLIYYRKGTSGAFTSAIATTISGSTYTFTINNAAIGGVTANDIIQYYVAAQDTASPVNVATNPAGGSGTNPPGSTAPASFSSYTILPVINSFPYSQDFEANNGGWSAGLTAGTTSDWEYGTFAKTTIPGPFSGTKAWVTKLVGNYSLNTTSTLTSPVIDFSSVTGRPTFTFRNNFDQSADVGFDAGILEYSIDGGTTWIKVDATLGTGGTFNTTDSTNWYNNSSTNGSGTGVTQPKWSGNSNLYTGHTNGWILSTTLLPAAVVGQSDVRLRFRFGSDTTAVDEGWAVDDVSITPPAPMTYVSSTTTQAVGAVALNSTNQRVIGIQVVTTGTTNPISATSFALNTNGTTNVADISNAKLFYTGTSSIFAATTQFGATVPSPSGSYSITGTQVLSSGTNYFWLTYDIPNTATVGNVVDAENTSITVNSVVQTPTITAPAGNNPIQAIVTIPAGNPSNGTSRKPLGAFFGFERSAAIYTAAELGLTGGSTINTIGWYLDGTTGTVVNSPTKVYMKTTTASTFPAATTVSTEVSGATLVYDATTTLTFTAGSYMTLNLTTPFIYSGDNLEIIVETNFGGAGGDGSGTAKQFRYSTVASSHQTWDQDTTAPTGTGTIVSTRPNIQFNYSPPASAPAGTVQFSSATYSVGEGGTMATLTVTRTGGSNGAVTVNYALAGGTATGGGTCGGAVDYVNTGGSVTFGNGDMMDKTFDVPICDDALFETPNETFNATLSIGSGGATLGTPNPAAVTITENDAQPSIQFSSSTAPVGEGGGTVSLQVTRTGALGNAVSASYGLGGGTATGGGTCAAGVDYNNTGGTVSFASGETTMNIVVPICDDSIYETPDETFVATLSMPTGGATLGQATNTVTITENDAQPTFVFSAATYSVSEGVGTASFTVTRSGALGGTDTVVAATVAGGTATGGGSCAAGIDYITASPTLTFNPTETTKTLDVTFCQDALYETPNETVNIALSNPLPNGTLGTPNSAVVTINEDDTAPSLQFSSMTYSNSDDLTANVGKADEFAPSLATITVTRTGATENAVSVNFATVAGGSATGGALCAAGSGIDYVSTNGTLNFASGVTMQTFNITVCTDALFEGDETVNLALTSPTVPAILGTPNTAVLTIVDNETIPTLQFSSPTYSNSDDIAKFGVTTDELAPSVATITVTRTGATDNAVSVQFATMGGSATGDVACTTGIDYITTSGTLNFVAGDNSETFNVTVCTDALFEGNETVNLVLSNPLPSMQATLGMPNSAVLTIIDNDAQPSLQFSSPTYSVGEAGLTATIIVTRTGAADNAVSVSYATVAGGTATGGAVCGGAVDYQNTSGTLSFVAGDLSETFTVPICDDTTAESTETVNLALTSPVGAVLGTQNTAVLSILDNDTAPTLQFSAASVSVSEATASVTLTVTRSGAAGNAVTVDYATGGGTATAGACAPGVDYVATSGTLNFASGETSKMFNVPICNDSVYELNQTFDATLTNATGGATIGTPSVETVTINNDDAAPTVTINDISQAEGNSATTNFQTTVTVSGPSEVSGGFNFQTADGTATAPSDYTAIAPTAVVIPANVNRTTAVLNGSIVLVNGDTTVEPDETFFLNGSICTDCSFADNQGVATIQNDDTSVQFAQPFYTVSEGAGSIVLTVTRAGSPTGAIGVNYVFAGGSASGAGSCAPGIDYAAVSGTLNWANGDSASKTINVSICDDALLEGNENFLTFLNTPTGGATIGTQSSTDTTITDNDSDTTAPTISYTPIPNNSFNPTLVVTATDNVGVTGVTIFYSFNGGAFTPAACSFSTGSPTNGTWNCLIAGMPTPASVAYYVTATDGTNTTANPTTGATAPNLFTFANATIPAGTYTIANLSGSTTLAGNIVVNQSLTLNGIVNTGANKITLGCGATVTGGGEGSYVVGRLERFFCGVETFTFNVGAPFELPPTAHEGTRLAPEGVSNYSPLTVTITGGDVNSSLTVNATDAFLPGSMTSSSASRYWTITENGNLTADLALTYRNEDVNGDESTYKVLRRAGGVTTQSISSTNNPATNTATILGVTNFSDWAVGNLIPTAANASLGGRVVTASGQGIRNATVVITGGGLTAPRYATTGTFGYYLFDGLPVGESYVVTVVSKRYTFPTPSIVVNLQENIADINFEAENR